MENYKVEKSKRKPAWSRVSRWSGRSRKRKKVSVPKVGGRLLG